MNYENLQRTIVLVNGALYKITDEDFNAIANYLNGITSRTPFVNITLYTQDSFAKVNLNLNNVLYFG